MAMPNRRYEVTIRNGAPLSWTELQEIIEIIEDHLKDQLFEYLLRYGDYPYFSGAKIGWRRRPYELEQEFFMLDQASFIEIEEVRDGSIILVIIGGAATFALGAVAVGVRRSRLPTELARLGQTVGNLLGDGLHQINNRLEHWSQANSALRNRRTYARVRKLPDGSEDEDHSNDGIEID